MADCAAASVLVIGVGNELRGDDGAGVVVARRLRATGVPRSVVVSEEQGEPIGLLDAWTRRDAVVLVDTMRSGARPGTVCRLDASHEPIRGGLGAGTSTHAVGLGEAIELGRALGRLPDRVIVHAVEGRRFHAAAGLSAEVEAAIPALLAGVRRDLGALAAGRRSGAMSLP